MNRTLLLILLAACARSSSPPPAAPCPAVAPAAAGELVVVASAHDHATTLARALAAIEERGLTVVARIDHADAAQRAGLALDATQVLVFGNPKVGTPLMQAVPQVALDLPLRLLVWQRDGKVQVAYRPPRALAKDHPIAAKMGEVLAAIAAAATN